MLRGRCLCGTVSFVIDHDDLGDIVFCHCDNCQRASGSMFSCNAPVSNTAFHVISGQHVIKSYESSPGTLRCFCSNCGSPVFTRKANDPKKVRVRLGLLEPHVMVRPKGHFLVRFKPAWYDITDDLPQYE